MEGKPQYLKAPGSGECCVGAKLGADAMIVQSKHKQSKAEANSAQNALQKEITTLRDTNRTLQLRLRDIEVSNDDFERQARNTTSSLEDVESKYNISIERGVMAEEEIRAGEQEREALRIETQRLRDELSDLKIEAEIRQDKLRHAEETVDKLRRRKPSPLTADLARPPSALSEMSLTTSDSSPTFATPPTKSVSSEVSETLTPPSPPTSEKDTPALKTPGLSIAKSRLSLADTNTTPRPSYSTNSVRAPRHTRGPSFGLNVKQTPSQTRRTTLNRPKETLKTPGIPHSGSLFRIRDMQKRMDNIEDRITKAKSKLPGPTSTPPHSSPRGGAAQSQSYIPATVTLRSNKKRTGGSNASSVHTPGDRASSRLSSAFTPVQDRPSSRLSFGMAQSSPSRDPANSRPPSRDPNNSRPPSRAGLTSRPSISNLSYAAASSSSRPASRQSMTGTRTPLGHYASSSQSESRRPRSSISGSYASTHGHGHSASVSRLSGYGSQKQFVDEEESNEVLTPTPSRRTTLEKGGSTIPSLASASAKRTTGFTAGRRISSGQGSDMGPPTIRGTRKLSGVGETF